ncbi:MAG: type II toxin-antitoxin system RelB/DinJ family antitoxin [Oscillospiraceae bacterium]|jgi:DNA-damage-inducible protein J|nr:type II toxin-antitoxin system RelB/DinJ family antitoxin [Oscillospiraceae bacterium]
MNNIKATVNVKIDANVKETAAALLAGMGIDQTTAIEMYYRKIIAVKALPFQPEPIPSTGELLLAAIKRRNIPNITLPADENGHAFIDKDKYPELYEWAEQG